jgi:uncharacterized protein (DUF1697 family)
MAAFVSLLRGVNVSGRRQIVMADLRASLEAVGLGNVETYLQSGNVVFDTEADSPRELAAAIEGRIGGDLGHHVEVLVLRSEEMRWIAASNPFLSAPGIDEKWLHATFLFRPASEAAFGELVLPARPGESATLVGQVVWLCLPSGYGRTRLSNAFFERALDTYATTRNWRTVQALASFGAAR